MLWNELKLHSKTHNFKKKLYACRGCFSQVQQVKLVDNNLEYKPVIFIDTHNYLQKVWKLFYKFRVFTTEQKKYNLIGVTSHPGCNLLCILSNPAGHSAFGPSDWPIWTDFGGGEVSDCVHFFLVRATENTLQKL